MVQGRIRLITKAWRVGVRKRDGTFKKFKLEVEGRDGMIALGYVAKENYIVL